MKPTGEGLRIFPGGIGHHVPGRRVKVVVYAPMKIYLVAYWPRPEQETPRKGPGLDNYDFQFSSERAKGLKFEALDAERELITLRQFQFRVNEHLCHFELEEEEGTFAIICKDHPAEVRG
jgi:hypothetical protein